MLLNASTCDDERRGVRSSDFTDDITKAPFAHCDASSRSSVASSNCAARAVTRSHEASRGSPGLADPGDEGGVSRPAQPEGGEDLADAADGDVLDGEHHDERDEVDACEDGRLRGRARGRGGCARGATRPRAIREQRVAGPGEELVDEGRGTPLLGGDVDDGLVFAATAGRGDDAEPTHRVMDADGQGTGCFHVRLLRRRRGLATGTPPQAVAYATESSGGSGAITRARSLRISCRYDTPQERTR